MPPIPKDLKEMALSNISYELTRQTLNSEKKGVAIINGGVFSTEDQKREIELETEKGHYFARVWAKTSEEISSEIRQATDFVRQAKPRLTNK